jgi:hydroxyacylglutathione hydrolase
VLVERSMHPDWLSNAYLVADEEGGAAVFVDSGADVEPLLGAAERWHVKPAFVLRTHSHHDHVVHEAELGLPVHTDAVEVGGLRIEALPTPGHSDDMETRVLPGHTDETTIGREWEENPFVRVWRGAQAEGSERVRVGGEDATLIVWSPDYDGGGKAWVRFEDGRDAIVGGSRVERG